MKKKRKISTSDGDETNLSKGSCQPALETTFRTDPKTIWKFFASNADSSGQFKMTPTCVVRRNFPILRNISDDTEKKIISKVRKKRQRNGATSLLPDKLQLKEVFRHKSDTLESEAVDSMKKKKKKKRVNKSVKRRLALATEAYILTTTGSESCLRRLAEPATDHAISSDSRSFDSTVPVSLAAEKAHRCSNVRSGGRHFSFDDIDGGHPQSQGISFNSAFNFSMPKSSKAFPIENYKTLKVFYLL